MGWYPGKMLRGAIASQEAPPPTGTTRPPDWLITALQSQANEELATAESYEYWARELERYGWRAWALVLREAASDERRHRSEIQDILRSYYDVYVRGKA